MYQTTWADIEREENPPERVKCPDCGEWFTPTPDNEKFCTRCNANFIVSKRDPYEPGPIDPSDR